ITNSSGPTGKSGLGEPKFNMLRIYCFSGPSATRTNVDGPALRASAKIQYAEWLLKNSNSTYVERSLWPVIQLDVDYAATCWREPMSANFCPSLFL
ncbi:hypothetical protein F5888DRAFT_1606131, partial [Russula emetica]